MATRDPHGLNLRQRKFVELLTAGTGATNAYVAAGYSSKGADAAACKLRGNPRVAAAIADSREHLIEHSRINKERMIDKLVRIINSKPSEAHLENPLCELKMTQLGPCAVFPDKGACIDKLAKLLGWYAPEKKEDGGLKELAAALQQIGLRDSGPIPSGKL